LKGWWDNLSTEHDKLAIIKSAKTETNQEDAVSTLIYSIIQNFVGDPNIFKEISANQLAICIVQPCQIIGGIKIHFYQK